MRLRRLGGDDDVGAVAGRPQRYGLADATAGAGDEQGFAGQVGHGDYSLNMVLLVIGR